MKKALSILLIGLLTMGISAQAPEKLGYQAVVRDGGGQLVTNQPVGMRVSLLQGSETGTEVYREIYNPNPQTNANGLVTVEVGSGIPLTGVFRAIDWANGPYFIKTETDPTGGTNYTIMGTSQLLSVPYALHAKTAERVVSAGPFYVGQDTLGGIVYYVYTDNDGRQRGLIVSKVETQAQWQSSPSFTNANRSWDGAYNTSLITDSPAKDWIQNNLGSDWYLPSPDELHLLMNNMIHVNKALHENGYDVLQSRQYYWSSMEFITSNNAYAFYLISGGALVGKIGDYLVRGVRSF